MMIDPRAKTALEVLRDGRWHDRFLNRVITPRVMQACVELGLVKQRTEQTELLGWRRFTLSFRITPKGRQALRGGRQPNRQDFSLVLKSNF